MGETDKLNLVERNDAIDDVFKQIKQIVDYYLRQYYPAAPDPDVCIDKIQEQVNNYYMLTV